MFKHSGKQLKVAAYVMALLGLAASIAVGLELISANRLVVLGHPMGARTSTLVGLAVMLGGVILSWVLGLAVHAFGELVEKTKDNNYLLSRIAAHTKDLHDRT